MTDTTPQPSDPAESAGLENKPNKQTPHNADASSGQAEKNSLTSKEPKKKVGSKPSGASSSAEAIEDKKTMDGREALEDMPLSAVPRDEKARKGAASELLVKDVQVKKEPATEPLPGPISEKAEPEKILAEPEQEEVKKEVKKKEPPKTPKFAAPAPTPAPPKVEQPKAAIITPARQATNFMAKFQDKLKELRGKANRKRSAKVEKNLEKIMKYARKTQKATNDDVERLTGVSDRQALRYLKKLVKNRSLMKFGAKKNTFYKPIKK